MAALDHLVVAARDLASGAAWLEERLGTPLAAGGRHAAMGTHNRLLRLGEQCYLEVIAIDPEAPPPGRPRWFGLDDPGIRVALSERPRLIHWVARCDNLASEAAACATSPGEVVAMARGDYRWRITIRPDGGLPGGGLLPSLIQWDVPFHPADRLPESGCRLMKLEAFTAGAAALHSGLASLGLSASLAVFPPLEDGAGRLVAYLATPAGLVELD